MLKPLAVEFICNTFPQLIVFAMGLGYCYFVGLEEGLLHVTLEVKPPPNFECLYIKAMLGQNHIFKGQ